MRMYMYFVQYSYGILKITRATIFENFNLEILESKKYIGFLLRYNPFFGLSCSERGFNSIEEGNRMQGDENICIANFFCGIGIRKCRYATPIVFLGTVNLKHSLLTRMTLLLSLSWYLMNILHMGRYVEFSFRKPILRQ